MNNARFATLIKRVNFYPPFLGMGIRVRSHSDDFTRFDVELRERWFTRNLFGTHFGGSLYTMADPFFVFIVTMNLGRDYIVWDKSAAIDFLLPARGRISATFEIGQDRLRNIRDTVDRDGKGSFEFMADLLDESGQVVARVRKTVYARRKDRSKAA